MDVAVVQLNWVGRTIEATRRLRPLLLYTMHLTGSPALVVPSASYNIWLTKKLKSKLNWLILVYTFSVQFSYLSAHAHILSAHKQLSFFSTNLCIVS